MDWDGWIMPELSWNITSVPELDYDGISVTVKQVEPKIDGVALPHLYVRASTETDVDSKTVVKADLTDKEYTWTSEV